MVPRPAPRAKRRRRSWPARWPTSPTGTAGCSSCWSRPISYRDISARLGMPIGSIGPTRARILAHLQEALAPVGLHDLVLS